MSKAKPKIDFVGIGVSKCGTTWVHRCLAAHPDVCCEHPKETHFFTQNFYRGFQWYAKQFAHCSNEKVRGEFSPEYIYDEQALKRIREHYPDSKIIIVLRNPLERLQSLWKFNYIRGSHSELSFQKFIEKHCSNDVISQGLYYKYINRVLEYFDKESIHIIFHEDIKEQPAFVLEKLYDFLGLPVNLDLSILSKKINNSDNAYLRFRIVSTTIFKIRRFFKQKPVLSKMVDTARILGLTRMIGAVLKMNRTHKKKSLDHLDKNLNQVTKQELWLLYKKDVEKLDDLTGRGILESWRKAYSEK